MARSSVLKWTYKIPVVSSIQPPYHSLSYICIYVYCLTISVLRHLKQHGDKYRKMDLLSCNWASSICCYGSGWVGNQIPPVSPSAPPLPSQTLLLSLCTKDGGMCNTRWSNTLRFMDNALSQTVSQCINWPFLLVTSFEFHTKENPGKYCLVIGVNMGFLTRVLVWVLPALVIMQL